MHSIYSLLKMIFSLGLPECRYLILGCTLVWHLTGPEWTTNITAFTFLVSFSEMLYVQNLVS